MQQFIIFLFLIISIWIVMKHFLPNLVRSCLNRTLKKNNPIEKTTPISVSFCSSCHHCPHSKLSNKCKDKP